MKHSPVVPLTESALSPSRVGWQAFGSGILYLTLSLYVYTLRLIFPARP